MGLGLLTLHSIWDICSRLISTNSEMELTSMDKLLVVSGAHTHNRRCPLVQCLHVYRSWKSRRCIIARSPWITRIRRPMPSDPSFLPATAVGSWHTMREGALICYVVAAEGRVMMDGEGEVAH